MRSLLAGLTDHPMALLRGIAAVRGVALTTNVRADAAAQLAAALVERGATEAALAARSAQARAAWEALCRANGRMKAPTFTREFGAIRPQGPGKLEREQSWAAPVNAAEELWFAGLIFKAFADEGDGLLEFVYIPADLLVTCAKTNTVREEPAPAAVRPPHRQIEAHNSLAVDAVQILATLRGTPMRLDRAGQLRAAERRQLMEGLIFADPTRLDLLLALLLKVGALFTERGRLQIATDGSQAWLRQGSWPQITALFQAWLDSAASEWNDLHHLPGLKAEGNWRNDPLAARQAVVERLRGLPPGEWQSLDALTATIKHEDPDFQRPEGNYTDWYLRDIETGVFLTGFESWDRVDGALIRFIVTGPLYWLGAVSLGMTADGAVEAFRLTPVGLAWVGGDAVPDPPRPARLSFEDDLTIVAPLHLPLMARYRLLRFTEPIASTAQTIPHATRHRISRESLAKARAEGVKAGSLQKYLDEASGGKTPQRISAGLERWDQHSGTVRVSRGAVLRVEDASTLSLLRADPVLRPLLGEMLSAQAILVSEPNLPRVLAALRELGYGVKVDSLK